MCKVCESNRSKKFDENYSLKEWLGFNYDELLEEIKTFIDNDPFKFLRAKNKAERQLGLLNPKQISKLKDTLKDAFENGDSILDVAANIKKNVNLPDRMRFQDGELQTHIESGVRSVIIARTEVTRSANGGAIERFRNNGIKRYAWQTTVDGRECAECDAKNGLVVDINSGVQPPEHVNCRCSLVAVVPLFEDLL